MLSFYVFASIVGLSLLALGALGGDSDAEMDLGAEVDDLDISGVDDLGTSEDAAWKRAFSLRSVAYFLAGFGATGLLLTLIGAAPALTALLAVGMGAFAALLVIVLFGWLRSTEGGFARSSDAYVGSVGRVRVAIRPSVPGTVDIEHNGQVITMRARALGNSDSDPAGWTDVLVVDVDPEEGMLLVQPIDELLVDDRAPAPGRLHP